MTILRVVIFTGAGPRLLLPFVASRHKVIGVVDSNPEEITEHPLYKILRWFYWIFFKFRIPPKILTIAKRAGVSYFNLKPKSQKGLVSWLTNLRPDVMVVYMSPILGENIFSIPKFGTLNLHPSLLPKYRGGHPILWMARDFELTGGVTVHFIDEGADTGDIVYQESFKISPGTSEEEIEKRAIEKHGIGLALKALDNLSNGHYPRIQQPTESPTPFAKRLAAEELWKLIQWNEWPLIHVWHFLRCNPFWHYKLGTLKGVDTIHNWSIGDYEEGPVDGEPGYIDKDSRGRFFIHPKGKIRILCNRSYKNIIKWFIKMNLSPNNN